MLEACHSAELAKVVFRSRFPKSFSETQGD